MGEKLRKISKSYIKHARKSLEFLYGKGLHRDGVGLAVPGGVGYTLYRTYEAGMEVKAPKDVIAKNLAKIAAYRVIGDPVINISLLGLPFAIQVGVATYKSFKKEEQDRAANAAAAQEEFEARRRPRPPGEEPAVLVADSTRVHSNQELPILGHMESVEKLLGPYQKLAASGLPAAQAAAVVTGSWASEKPDLIETLHTEAQVEAVVNFVRDCEPAPLAELDL